jgi:hypothetical protein
MVSAFPLSRDIFAYTSPTAHIVSLYIVQRIVNSSVELLHSKYNLVDVAWSGIGWSIRYGCWTRYISDPGTNQPATIVSPFLQEEPRFRDDQLQCHLMDYPRFNDIAPVAMYAASITSSHRPAFLGKAFQCIPS